ncbi:hypothetical protein AB0F16_16925 [Streptomyces tanashiensis]|uniref:hypothetical protein n=1 Tax=Streptomyces tanashiensis TaxID=67367 RepID=UPI0033DA1797
MHVGVGVGVGVWLGVGPVVDGAGPPGAPEPPGVGSLGDAVPVGVADGAAGPVAVGSAVASPPPPWPVPAPVPDPVPAPGRVPEPGPDPVPRPEPVPVPEPSDEPALTWRGRAETVLGASVTGAALDPSGAPEVSTGSGDSAVSVTSSSSTAVAAPSRGGSSRASFARLRVPAARSREGED